MFFLLLFFFFFFFWGGGSGWGRGQGGCQWRSEAFVIIQKKYGGSGRGGGVGLGGGVRVDVNGEVKFL